MGYLGVALSRGIIASRMCLFCIVLEEHSRHDLLVVHWQELYRNLYLQSGLI